MLTELAERYADVESALLTVQQLIAVQLGGKQS